MHQKTNNEKDHVLYRLYSMRGRLIMTSSDLHCGVFVCVRVCEGVCVCVCYRDGVSYNILRFFFKHC